MDEDEGRSPITALPFPPGDLVFALRVQEALRDLEGLSVGEAVDRLCRRLRPVHLEVDARLRSDIAGFGHAPVVYLFRDGLARRAFSGRLIVSKSASFTVALPVRPVAARAVSILDIPV